MSELHEMLREGGYFDGTGGLTLSDWPASPPQPEAPLHAAPAAPACDASDNMRSRSISLVQAATSFLNHGHTYMS